MKLAALVTHVIAITVTMGMTSAKRKGRQYPSDARSAKFHSANPQRLNVATSVLRVEFQRKALTIVTLTKNRACLISLYDVMDRGVVKFY